MSYFTKHPTAKPLHRDTPESVVIRIKRRANPDASQYWEEFEIPYRPHLNIILCLMEIRKNPVTKEGKQTTPVVWEMSCLESVCGICTMILTELYAKRVPRSLTDLKCPSRLNR